ncbi:hypothetical protein BDV95DRAFT_607582 [Massariosphaeria phaeospora]|uniref:Uncharacterized protein n=1 Tax=Massariosphaeria phaeospora TaxID=100035 RepID=A0A7C8IEV5_9PLEO|nr:hypothetical protein BDV95DRAFT_607582 [Massariosphaeria phaeospora]
MPASKRQKTSTRSSASTRTEEDKATPHKNDKNEANNTSETEEEGDPHEYICIPRDLFDAEAEKSAANVVDSADTESGDSNAESDELDAEAETPSEEPASSRSRQTAHEIYSKDFKEGKAKGIYGSLASKHPDWKWVTMRAAFDKHDFLRLKEKYCDPDFFGMYIYNDWKGWGLQEITENLMVEFDNAFHKKGGPSLNEMWVLISALGRWIASDPAELINNEDGETVCKLCGLIGCALLTMLRALDSAGELKPQSTFLDLPLVISFYLAWSHDLPAYGIEGDVVAWRKQAVALFKRGNLDPSKGIFSTAKLLDKLEKAPNYDGLAVALGAVPEPESEDYKDPGDWETLFKKYKKGRNLKMGRTHYDITKMSRAERASYAFDRKDPLAHVSVEDLKNDRLDFV